MHGMMLPLLDVPVTTLSWHLHLETIAALIVFEGLYLFVLARMQRQSPETRPISDNSVLLFTLGVLVIYVSIGTPLDELSDHFWLSAHMLQHLLLTMVAAPLLLLGTPGWMLRPVLVREGVFPFAYVLTRPFVAFALFNLSLVFVHLPSAMSIELSNEYTVHFAAHALLITTGMLMWWPLLGSVPELPRLSYGLQLVYIFVQSFVPAILTAFLIFTNTTIYPVYEALPRLFGLSAINDQRIGGLIMKLGGGAILSLVATIIFFTWFNKEEQEEPPIPPPPPSLAWRDVEDELARMGLTERAGLPPS